LSEMSLEELWQLFPIILSEHKSEYKDWYLEEKENLKGSLDTKIIEGINQIGSTAVKGLISKPTVDILLEVDSSAEIDKLKIKLENAGWRLMSYEKKPKLKITFNKGYTLDGFAEKVFHLHLRHLGDWDELYFRDYLIAHKELAKKYGKLKQRLKEQYQHNRDGYTEAKTEFINKWTEAARKEFPERYLP
ncbi:MAG: GrpB family protein, partial [Halarsenatibacteraceae bacterium]